MKRTGDLNYHFHEKTNMNTRLIVRYAIREAMGLVIMGVILMSS